MSNLSVIDVQKLLRQHANLGHDVYSKPHTALLGEVDDPMAGNKPFGMAITHHLWVPDTKSYSESVLTSYLAHGEKPSATRVDSTIDPEKGRLTHRTATLMNPATVLGDWADDGGVRHMYGEAFGLGHLKHTWRLGHVLAGTPEKNTSEPLHETLRKHLSAPVTYMTHDAKTGTNDIGPRSAHGWNPREANESLADLHPPFSNKIHVMHHSGEYSYNPNTEQLLEL